jgi:hypothetical protein
MKTRKEKAGDYSPVGCFSSSIISAAEGHSSGWNPSSVMLATAVGMCVFCSAGGVAALVVLERLRVWTGTTGTRNKREGTRKHRNKHTWSRGRWLRRLHTQSRHHHSKTINNHKHDHLTQLAQRSGLTSAMGVLTANPETE